MLNEKTFNCDLCVVGGGMAGICTAISAARHGVKVVLMHERSVLGGNASSEMRMWVCGARGTNNRETGIIEEIMLESLYRNPTKNFYIWDSILLDFIKREENITLLMNTTCMDADSTKGEYKDGRDTHINSVRGYQMTTQTFCTVKADYFADCSGDSIIAPLVNAEFMYGRESAYEYGEDIPHKEHDRRIMGMSCLIQCRETTHKVPYIPSEFVNTPTEEDVENRPMYLECSSENFWYLELGGNDDTIADAEKTKDKLIPLALGTWNYIKNSGKYDTDTWELEFLGNLPAKRESRRMLGEVVVSQKDISNSVIYPDTVAYGGWPLDDHFPDGYYHRGEPNTNFSTPAPYTLPYRALYSKNVDNLFFAGRNISVTHTAMSSTRVMATCGILGQAVGGAVAIAKKYNTTPHGVYLNHITELQKALMNDDCFLPHFKREVSGECKKALLINGSSELNNGEDRPNKIYNTETKGVELAHGEWLEYQLDTPTLVNSIHLVFDSDLNRETLPGDACERGHVTRANVMLTSPQMHLPKTLCKSFELTAVSEGKEITLISKDINIKRYYHLPVGLKLEKIKLKVTSNWGETASTKIVSFDFN